MNEFAMCPECEAEYHDIRSRRYHAQPDCCGTCGPQVFFRPAEGGAFRQDQALPAGEDAFRQARKLLADGGILAVKGIGGVHLACDALNPDAVKRLRERKHRPEKPLALMCRSLEAAAGSVRSHRQRKNFSPDQNGPSYCWRKNRPFIPPLEMNASGRRSICSASATGLA